MTIVGDEFDVDSGDNVANMFGNGCGNDLGNMFGDNVDCVFDGNFDNMLFSIIVRMICAKLL